MKFMDCVFIIFVLCNRILCPAHFHFILFVFLSLLSWLVVPEIQRGSDADLVLYLCLISHPRFPSCAAPLLPLVLAAFLLFLFLLLFPLLFLLFLFSSSSFLSSGHASFVTCDDAASDRPGVKMVLPLMPAALFLLLFLSFPFSCPSFFLFLVIQATQASSRVMMQHLTAPGVKMVLPLVLAALESDQWRTKYESIRLLGAMAFCAPKQLSFSLPKVVPRLLQVMGDPHPKVWMGGKADRKHGGGMRNVEGTHSIVPLSFSSLSSFLFITQSCAATLPSSGRSSSESEDRWEGRQEGWMMERNQMRELSGNFPPSLSLPQVVLPLLQSWAILVPRYERMEGSSDGSERKAGMLSSIFLFRETAQQLLRKFLINFVEVSFRFHDLSSLSPPVSSPHW